MMTFITTFSCMVKVQLDISLSYIGIPEDTDIEETAQSGTVIHILSNNIYL